MKRKKLLKNTVGAGFHACPFERTKKCENRKVGADASVCPSERGITLIALVITIIVLLILAGITISMVVGENGILTRAKEAKAESEKAGIKENLRLEFAENDIEEITTGIGGYSKDEFLGIINKYGTLQDDLDTIITHNGNYEISLKEVYDGVVPTMDEEPGVLAGSGTATDPYFIESIEDLVAFSQAVDGGKTYEGQYVKMTNSLDFKSKSSYVDHTRTDMGDINENGTAESLLTELITEKGFNPIGGSIAFGGNFNGNGKEIININIYRPNESNVGLFSNTKDAIITDIGIKGGKVVGKDWCGGISGSNSGTTISGCYNSANIEGERGVGGISGSSGGGTISGCYNSAKITSSDQYCGGIVGECASTIKFCYNYGDIYGNSQVGGCIGDLMSDTEGIYNLGNVEGNSIVGGIIGLSAGNLIDCYNKGSVEGQSSVGTICGSIWEGEKTTGATLKGSRFETIGTNSSPNEYEIDIKELEESEMPSVIDKVGGPNWKEDTNNINNGYPILYWQ